MMLVYNYNAGSSTWADNAAHCNTPQFCTNIIVTFSILFALIACTAAVLRIFFNH